MINILIAIIWIGYGAFAAYQTDCEGDLNDKAGYYFLYIIFAPIVFIIKALYGAFKIYD